MTGGSEHFFVYAIMFDQDMFGIFSTREAAEESLAKQIAEGGPAWEDCKVERWRVQGEPERGEQARRRDEASIDAFEDALDTGDGQPSPPESEVQA